MLARLDAAGFSPAQLDQALGESAWVAGSHSARMTGRGQVRASASAVVVTPAEPRGDKSAYSVTSAPAWSR
jgi:hypothetical protein